MVIGRGDIASVLKDKEGYTYFAAGFANRQLIDSEKTGKEIDSYLNYISSIKMFDSYLNYISSIKMFVYFSSLSIYYSDNNYVGHKKKMEMLISSYQSNHCILRIGNITWGNNPNTLINSLRHKIHNDIPFEIQDTYRYLIDKDEFLHWVDMIPRTGKHEMNVTGRRMKVAEIVKEIESGRL